MKSRVPGERPKMGKFALQELSLPQPLRMTALLGQKTTSPGRHCAPHGHRLANSQLSTFAITSQ